MALFRHLRRSSADRNAPKTPNRPPLRAGGLIEQLEPRSLFSAVPAITTQPVSNTFAVQGDTATFTAAATGDPTPTVQWEVSVDGVEPFAPITDNASATTSTLVIPDVRPLDQFNQYEAVFTNSEGTAATSLSTLYVEAPAAPTVSTEPTSQAMAAAGDTATFTAAATSDPGATVQWYVEPAGSKSFTPITGNTSATTPTLSLPDTSAAADGNRYEAIFTNAGGSVSTEPVTLSVPEPATSGTTAPTAALTATVLKKAASGYLFAVTYSGSSAIDTTTFNKHNVFVTGPGGFDQSATFISFASSNGRKTVTATYRLKSTAAHFSSSSNGTYHVYVRANQVKDVDGDFVAGSILGPFKILIA